MKVKNLRLDRVIGENVRVVIKKIVDVEYAYLEGQTGILTNSFNSSRRAKLGIFLDEYNNRLKNDVFNLLAEDEVEIIGG